MPAPPAALPLQASGGHAAVAVEDPLGWLAVSAMLVAAGALAMRRAFRRRRQRLLIQETPTEDVESVTLGPSEVTGTAVPADAPLRAPFSDDDCLVARWSVERYHEDEDSSGWRRVAAGVECVPFYVDDGTGRLLVEPDESVVYDLRDTEDALEVRAGQQPPAAVREFLGRRRTGPLGRLRDDLSAPVGFPFGPGTGLPFGPGTAFPFGQGGGFDFDGDGALSFGGGGRRAGDRRFSQQLLRPGEDVYVFGTVQRREGARSARNPENLVVRRVPRRDRDLEPLFLVSDRPEALLTASRRWALLWFPAGALLATVGVGGLVLGFAELFGVEVTLF